jgi:hypothetical protein
MNEKEIKIARSRDGMKKENVPWDAAERSRVESRILNLRKDQIGALAVVVCGFRKEDAADVAQDIRHHGTKSGHLPILMEEATSQSDLLWWLDYFENAGGE